MMSKSSSVLPSQSKWKQAVQQERTDLMLKKQQHR